MNEDIRNIGKSTISSFEKGEDVDIGHEVVIDTSGGVKIGDRVQIGRRCMIYTHDHNIKNLTWMDDNSMIYSGLEIGDDAFVGLGSIILFQVKRIGKGAIIGAGSVVTRDVPDHEIWAGNPAKKIGDRFVLRE